MAQSATQRDPGGDIDWQAIEASPEFQELVRERRSFVLPATIFFLAWYMGFILLTAYAESFMSERVYEGLTVGYCLALTQFLMVLVLGVLYLRRAETVFDPLAEKAIEQYAEHSGRYAASDGHGNGDAAVGSRAAGSEPEVAR
jgi:uncharacterized membrane protein (DUF485 family)